MSVTRLDQINAKCNDSFLGVGVEDKDPLPPPAFTRRLWAKSEKLAIHLTIIMSDNLGFDGAITRSRMRQTLHLLPRSSWHLGQGPGKPLADRLLHHLRHLLLLLLVRPPLPWVSMCPVTDSEQLFSDSASCRAALPQYFPIHLKLLLLLV